MTPDEREQYRKECEARQVLAWPFAQRRPYLDKVQEKRGLQARQELEEEIFRQHKLR